MKPFAIKVPIQTPMLASRGYLTLDSLLCEIVARDGEVPCERNVPLAVENGIFKASACFTFGVREVARKQLFARLNPFDLVDLYDQARPKRGGSYVIDQASGRYCASSGKFMMMSVEFVAWFAVGDPDETLRMLDRVPGIGCKVNMGYGAIDHDGIEIIEGIPDYSFALRGEPARPLPLEMWNGPCRQTGMAAVRYPYWNSARVMCALPSRANRPMRDFFRLMQDSA